MKRCPKCGLDLAIGEFNFRDKAGSRLQSYCRSCSNEAWRTWYQQPRNRTHHVALVAERRRRRIEENRALVRGLKSRPCADCGATFHPDAMDFDHVGQKTENVSKLVTTAGRDRLARELAECEVVCANCHRVRTAKRRQQ